MRRALPHPELLIMNNGTIWTGSTDRQAGARTHIAGSCSESLLAVARRDQNPQQSYPSKITTKLISALFIPRKDVSFEIKISSECFLHCVEHPQVKQGWSTPTLTSLARIGRPLNLLPFPKENCFCNQLQGVTVSWNAHGHSTHQLSEDGQEDGGRGGVAGDLGDAGRDETEHEDEHPARQVIKPYERLPDSPRQTRPLQHTNLMNIRTSKGLQVGNALFGYA